MEIGREVDRVDAHVDLLRGFVGRAQKNGPMVGGFGDGRFERQAGVKDAIASVREAIARRIEMGERCHDRRCPGPRYPILRRDQRKLARFFAQAVIGHRLDLEDSFKVCWIGDRLEEIDGRESGSG